MQYDELIRSLDNDEYEAFIKTVRAFQSVISTQQSARSDIFFTETNSKYDEIIRNLDQESYDNFVRSINLVAEAFGKDSSRNTEKERFCTVSEDIRDSTEGSEDHGATEILHQDDIFPHRDRNRHGDLLDTFVIDDTKSFKQLSPPKSPVLIEPANTQKKVYEYGENELDQNLSKYKLLPKPFLLHFEREWAKNKNKKTLSSSEEFKPKDLSNINSSKDLLLILRDSDRPRPVSRPKASAPEDDKKSTAELQGSLSIDSLRLLSQNKYHRLDAGNQAPTVEPFLPYVKAFDSKRKPVAAAAATNFDLQKRPESASGAIYKLSKSSAFRNEVLATRKHGVIHRFNLDGIIQKSTHLMVNERTGASKLKENLTEAFERASQHNTQTFKLNELDDKQPQAPVIELEGDLNNCGDIGEDVFEQKAEEELPLAGRAATLALLSLAAEQLWGRLIDDLRRAGGDITYRDLNELSSQSPSKTLELLVSHVGWLLGCNGESWHETKKALFKEFIPLLTFLKEVDPLTIPLPRIRKAVKASRSAQELVSLEGSQLSSAGEKLRRWIEAFDNVACLLLAADKTILKSGKKGVLQKEVGAQVKMHLASKIVPKAESVLQELNIKRLSPAARQRKQRRLQVQLQSQNQQLRKQVQGRQEPIPSSTLSEQRELPDELTRRYQLLLDQESVDEGAGDDNPEYILENDEDEIPITNTIELEQSLQEIEKDSTVVLDSAETVENAEPDKQSLRFQLLFDQDSADEEELEADEGNQYAPTDLSRAAPGPAKEAQQSNESSGEYDGGENEEEDYEDEGYEDDEPIADGTAEGSVDPLNSHYQHLLDNDSDLGSPKDGQYDFLLS